MRRRLYIMSAIAAAGLLVELAWFIEDRLQLHLVDRGIRVIDHVRDVARM